MTTKRAVGALVAIAAIGGTGLATVGASASPSASASKGGATIHMKLKGKVLKFTGSKTVKRGSKLKIVNDTNPQRLGPHTFTLLKQSKLPTTNKQRKACGHLEGVCGRVAKDHQVDPETFKVGKVIVDAGRKGWNKSFGRHGDTWFAETQGGHNSRRVTAKAGTTLYFACVVHPEMQGKIKVVR